MTTAQAQQIIERLNADPEMRAWLNAPPERCPDGATLAGMGVPYLLAGQPIRPPSAPAIAVLGLIRSPLVDGAEALAPMDAWRALWAVTCEPGQLACLHGLDARCEALLRFGRRLGMTHEQIAEGQARIVGQAYAEVDRLALETAARYPGASPQAVADLVGRMVADVSAGWALVPRSGGAATADDPQKMSRPPVSTATGSRGWLAWLRGLALRWTWRRYGGCLLRGSA